MTDPAPDADTEAALRRIAAGGFDRPGEAPPVDDPTLRRYIARESPPQERKRVAGWIVTDPRWRRRYAELVADTS